MGANTFNLRAHERFSSQTYPTLGAGCRRLGLVCRNIQCTPQHRYEPLADGGAEPHSGGGERSLISPLFLS